MIKKKNIIKLLLIIDVIEKKKYSINYFDEMIANAMIDVVGFIVSLFQS